MSAVRLALAGGAGVSLVAVLALAAPIVSKWEGRRLDPYVDLGGVITVCDGETAVPMRRYSHAECDAMLAAGLRRHAGPILECLPPSAPLEVKAAFTSLGYNIGVSNACGSKAAQFARAGDYRSACNAFASWNKVKVAPGAPWPCAPAKRYVSSTGTRYCVWDGLVNRRADERALCLKGLA